jgi:hypothetical protein
MGVPANAIDITQAGLVKFDGTSVFTGVTVTNHGTLVGAASNGITSVGPSVTTGAVLKSGGASADPAYSSSFTLSASDVMTNTAQPGCQSFVNTAQTNVTGDGTSFDVIFDGISDQQGSDYNTTTGKYTCAVSGYYFVAYSVTFTGITSAMTDGQAKILSSAGTITRKNFSAAASKTASNEMSISDSVITFRNAGETIYININIDNGAKVASTKDDFFGPFCYFSVFKLA